MRLDITFKKYENVQDIIQLSINVSLIVYSSVLTTPFFFVCVRFYPKN